jgi:hypothetical protein
VCGGRLFESTLRKYSRGADVLAWKEPGVVEGEFVEPSAELDRAGIDFNQPSMELGRPKPSVASFLRAMADDLDAHRASTVGRDFTFERIRITGPSYDVFFGRYDPNRDHPHRYRKG